MAAGVPRPSRKPRRMRPPRLDELPDVLTVPEAAAALRIGCDAAYDAIKHGELYAVRVGRSLRVPKAAVVDMLNPKASSGGDAR